MAGSEGSLAIAEPLIESMVPSALKKTDSNMSKDMQSVTLTQTAETTPSDSFQAQVLKSETLI